MPQAEMYKRHWNRKKQSKVGKERRFSLPPRLTSAQPDEAGRGSRHSRACFRPLQIRGSEGVWECPEQARQIHIPLVYLIYIVFVISFNPTATSWGRCYYSHFIDEKIKFQRD